MLIIFISVTMLLLFLIRSKTQSTINLIVPFTLFWIVSILMSKYLSSNLYNVDDKIYLYSYIFIFFTLLGFLIFSKKKNKNILIRNNHTEEIKKGNLILTFFHIIILVVLLYYLKKYNTIQATLPIYKIRIIRYQVGPLFTTPKELLFYNYVISSIVELFGLMSIVKIFSGMKIKLNTVIPLLSLIVYSFIGNGRFGLFNALIFIGSTLFFKKVLFNVENRKSISGKLKKKLLFSTTIGLLFVGMIKISSNRFQSKIVGFQDVIEVFKDSVEQAVIYFTGPFRALDYFFSYRSVDENYLYGKAFFSGIDEFMGLFISKINPDYITGNSVISDITRDPIAIGPATNFNAFYTAIFNSFLDLHYLGLIIFPFVLGSLAALVWNMHLKLANFYSFCLIVYFNLILISSEYRFELQQFKSYFVIGVLLYLANRKEKNNEL